MKVVKVVVAAAVNEKGESNYGAYFLIMKTLKEEVVVVVVLIIENGN